MNKKIDSKTWTIAEAGAALAKSGANFVTLFKQGTLEVEIYRPVGIDRQKPHKKDELYVVINGTGTFVHGSERTRLSRGRYTLRACGRTAPFRGFQPRFCDVGILLRT